MAKIKSVATLMVDGDWIESKDQSSEGIRLIQTGNVGVGEYLDKVNRAKYISEETLDRLKCTELISGDILISRLPDPIGRSCIVPDDIGRAITAVDCTIVRLNPKLCNAKYFVQYTQSDLYQSRLSQFFAGSTRTRISRKNLEQIDIPLPNIAEQELIASTLVKVDTLISLRKQQFAKLDELVKARFVELFGDPMTNDNGYVLKKYGDLFELNAGGTPSKQKSEYWDNGTISWIGSNMCQNTVIYENDGNYITEEGLKHSSARMFPVDTVLIALVGATIGKTALLKFETTTNQNVLGVRGIRESGYTPEFIFYYTQGLYQKFLDIGDGGFAMASKGFISELPVPVVDLTLQEQFTGFVKQTDKSKSAIQPSLDKLETLKKVLMQKYFG